MLFQWLFGKKSADSHIQSVWNLTRAKKLFSTDAEECLARAIIDYSRKADLLERTANITDDQLRRKIRELYQIEKRSLTEEQFEQKTLDEALHLLIDALTNERGRIGKLSSQESIELNRLKEKIEEWHENLQAQYAWLAAHPAITDIRKDLDGLKQLVAAEGQLLFSVKEKQLPTLVAIADAYLALTEYPPQSKIQELQTKESLRRKEWWSEQREDVIELYHAYPSTTDEHPLLSGGHLDLSASPEGFFMADTKQNAIFAVETAKAMGATAPRNLLVMRVLINKKVAQRLLVAVGSISIYFMIPPNKYAEANREIDRQFIRFEPA